jgi:hypothetical protein
MALENVELCDVGTRAPLANFLSARIAEAIVLAAPNSRRGVANGIELKCRPIISGVDL